jgi:hypothetical protein
MTSVNSKLTIASLLTTLRNHLFLAREQKNHAELEKLFAAFILIGDAAIEIEDETIIELAEMLEGVAQGALEEGDWKRKLPSEKEVQKLLVEHQ